MEARLLMVTFIGRKKSNAQELWNFGALLSFGYVLWSDGFLDVLNGNLGEVTTRIGRVLGDAVGLFLNDLFEYVTHVTGITEVLVFMSHGINQPLVQIVGSLVGDGVLVFLQVQFGEHLVEFIGCIVVEVDVTVEARLESGVGVDEALHLVVVAGYDDYQAVAVVFHSFEEGGDGFLSVVLSALFGYQRVGLVNEEHPVEGCIDYLVGLDGRLSHVFCHES